MAGIDTNRTTSGITLPPTLAEEIWGTAAYESAIMSLSRRIALPGNGLEIQMVTGDPIAQWTSETDAKPISNPTFDTKSMRAYKLAFIQLISDEAARDHGIIYDWMRTDGAKAIAKSFDIAVIHGTAPGPGFDDLSGATVIPMGTGYNVYTQLVSGKTAVATAGGSVSGWVFDSAGEGLLMAATDNNGRPLFIDSIASQEGLTRLFGAPILIRETAGDTGTPNIVGVAGDWSKTRYGIVSDINVEISRDATVFDGKGNGISMFQNNMIAIKVEAEVGFIAEDDSLFVKFSDEAAPEPEPGD